MSLFFCFWLCIILGICNQVEGNEGARTLQLSNGNQMPIVGLNTYFVLKFFFLHFRSITSGHPQKQFRLFLCIETGDT